MKQPKALNHVLWSHFEPHNCLSDTIKWNSPKKTKTSLSARWFVLLWASHLHQSVLTPASTPASPCSMDTPWPPQCVHAGWLTAERSWDHHVKCAVFKQGSLSLKVFSFSSLRLYGRSLHNTLVFSEKRAYLLCIVQTPMRSNKAIIRLEQYPIKEKLRGVEAAPI